MHHRQIIYSSNVARVCTEDDGAKKMRPIIRFAMPADIVRIRTERICPGSRRRMRCRRRVFGRAMS